MTLYQKFNEAGFAVIPLKDGRPTVKWSEYFNRLPTTEEVKGWRGREYGLVCGEPSGIIAIDIDTDDTAVIYALAGPSPVRKVGSKGFTAFYRYEGQTSTNWKHNGEVICELLSDKRLTTIPPSPHRKTGEPYVWLENELIGADLPMLGKRFIEAMDKLYPRPVPKIKFEHHFSEDIDLSEAAEMLDFIDPSMSRDEWIVIGMALRDEFGDAACNLWHEWSSNSDKYNLRDAQAAWRSFSHDGVTVGTLIHYAKEGGWEKQYQPTESEFTVDISYLFKKEPEALVVHGLVGEITQWITETAIRPQPTLALAAALTFVGMMKGHRVRGATNLRTNMLCLSLAPTSAGKDHPQRCVDRLASACGLSNHVMAEPTSGVALLTGLSKANCNGVLLIDEMGRFMSNISLKSSVGYQREITDNMIKLFSSAAYTFRGRQYANDKENPQVILHQPHFSCLGSTVPEKMQASCTSTEIIDGFLNRWLVFSTNNRPDKKRGIRFSEPPQVLVEKIMQWMDMNPRNTDTYGNPEPQEVRFTPEAWDIFVEYDEKSIKLLDSEPFPINQLYARSAEHVEKISICLADDGMIGVRDVQIAIQIVNQSNEQIKAFARGVVDNQHEADVNYVLDIIQRNPNISKDKITQKTRRIDSRKRNDILSQLVEGGDVIFTKNGKKTIFNCTNL